MSYQFISIGGAQSMTQADVAALQNRPMADVARLQHGSRIL
jgi:hypothetical protein